MSTLIHLCSFQVPTFQCLLLPWSSRPSLSQWSNCRLHRYRLHLLLRRSAMLSLPGNHNLRRAPSSPLCTNYTVTTHRYYSQQRRSNRVGILARASTPPLDPIWRWLNNRSQQRQRRGNYHGKGVLPWASTPPLDPRCGWCSSCSWQRRSRRSHQDKSLLPWASTPPLDPRWRQQSNPSR